MDFEESGVPLDDLDYKPADEGEMMLTPGTFSSKNPPRWVASKYKTTSKLISKAKPLSKNKKLAAKDHSPKITDQGIKLDIPINVLKEKREPWPTKRIVGYRGLVT